MSIARIGRVRRAKHRVYIRMEEESDLERDRRLVGTAARPSLSTPAVAPVMDLDSALTMHQLALSAQGASKHTLRLYLRVEREFIDYLRCDRPVPLLPVTLLTMDEARGWLLRLQARELSASSIQLYTTVLKVWAKFLAVEELLPRNPLERLRVQRAHPPVVQTFTAEQLGAMVRAAERGTLAWRNVAVLYFMIATGVRASELCDLLTADVDIRYGTATVVGKGRKPRRVHFDTTTGKVLIRYLAGRRADVPWLFLSRERTQWTRNGLAHMLTELGLDVGIRGVRVSPHTFRHTFAVNFLRAHPGAAFQLQDLMGHADLATTRRYVRFAETETELPGPSVVALLGLDKLSRR